MVLYKQRKDCLSCDMYICIFKYLFTILGGIKRSILLLTIPDGVKRSILLFPIPERIKRSILLFPIPDWIKSCILLLTIPEPFQTKKYSNVHMLYIPSKY